MLKDMKAREDLRHLTVCSVDPPGCTDIDDALHCRELDNGNFEVRIHFKVAGLQFVCVCVCVYFTVCYLFAAGGRPHC